MTKKLLEGIRVVDFSWFVTGPLTTQHFADLGAEVIIVESSKRSGARRGRYSGGTNDQICTSKLSVTLNTREPRGVETAKRLIARSDIVGENFSGETFERMGFGYDVLKVIKPDIIVLSSSMLGQKGPYASHSGTGHKLTAMAGFSNIIGWPDRKPGWIGAYSDFLAPRYNIIALMTALDYRRRTGRGQYIDMSQYEACLQFMSPLLLDYDVNRRVATRMGNRCAYAAPHGVYRCAGEERWCAIAVFNDEEWRSFCRVTGNEALTEDSRFSTLQARKENEDALDALVTAWTSRHTAEGVMQLLQEAGVAAGVVETGEDLMDMDPQLKHRGTFIPLEYPGVGTVRSVFGAHFQLSKNKTEMRIAPKMGEHNEYVFKGILGMSDAEYGLLVKDGVIA